MGSNIEKKFYYSEDKNKKNFIFKNAILVDPEAGTETKGSLLVVDGVIEAIGEVPAEEASRYNAAEVDCGGMHLAPALVEVQCHIGESGGEFKENIEQTSKSAVAGGVTTINIMPDTSPVIDSTMMVEFIKNRAHKKSYCDITVFGSITKDMNGEELSEIGLLKKAGAKAVSESSKTVSDTSVFLNACEYAANFGVKIVHQPQDCYLSNEGVMNEGEISTKLGVKGIPDISEKIGLERDLAIVEKTGVEYHALNISCKKAVETLSTARKSGMNITANVTPHHICLTEEKANNFRTFAKTNPPLRTDEDRLSLIEGIKSGDVDFISCNNMPRSEDQKRLPLAAAEFGVVGLETMFSASFTELSKHKISLPEIIKLLSTNPAEFLNLRNKGKLSKGSVADLFLFDINYKWNVSLDDFAGKVNNSPFDGEALQGKVLKTFISGELVYEENKC